MKPFLFALLASVFCAPAYAQQNAAPTNQGVPIEITATKSVEWLRDDKKYVARENVIVTQGNMTIKSDLLTADYREGEGSSMEIWQLTAEGHVQIADENNTAHGDKAIYDVTAGIATLTGQDLKLVSPDQTVTANERMEYHANTREAKAIGNAKVVRTNKDTLSADSISAFFKDSAASSAAKPAATNAPASPLGGGGNLDRLEADGHVIIKTPTETLYGNKATYRADSNTAELLGKVKVERDQNTLEGDRAEVNLNTNVSKMYGSGKDGRVRGVFFPGTEKSIAAPSAKAPTAVPEPTTAENTAIPAAPQHGSVTPTEQAKK